MAIGWAGGQRLRWWAGAVGGFGFATSSASAQSWLEREQLTGDWGGARTSMADHGIAVEGGFTSEWRA